MERRLAFGTVAELYDAARPSYPAALVDEVIAHAGGLPLRALEVGAGTGKATELFAGRGVSIVAVEPSSAMAAVASRKAATADVDVRVTDFEHADVEEGGFGLVYSAQAWHWVDPERRFGLAARALAPGGVLAAFWNRPDWDRCSLREPLAGAYERAGVTLQDAGPSYPAQPTNLDLGDYWAEQTGELFASAEARRYRWSHRYTSARYVDLLATHSDHIVLADADRERLFAEVGAVLDGHGGGIDLPWVTVLGLARLAG